MKQIPLIIERTNDRFVGRTQYDDNLIVADEKSLEKLEDKIREMLKGFHKVKPSEISFKHSYDLSALFEKFSYLKISNVAELAGINASLLRQYVTGNKQASSLQAKKIETAIHRIGKELQNIQVYGPVER
ncbi:hypothetical protein [Pseudoflavitalea rhizosphaerae]|uniref:hypothetical protein n=1 Tax=Pseudoflavitalea rhizosphaerae TaxID=1884793 RepID=UPI000F8E5EC1|nr:hypothetical protein [Pseudoflavitalea rhizosphaerae]